MKKYEKAIAEVIVFLSNDIITTSSDDKFPEQE